MTGEQSDFGVGGPFLTTRDSRETREMRDAKEAQWNHDREHNNIRVAQPKRISPMFINRYRRVKTVEEEITSSLEPETLWKLEKRSSSKS